MYTDFLGDAKALIGVIRLGSISALSKANGEHRATISKRISRIEDNLEVKIIKINVSNHISLTEEGIPIFLNLKHLINDLEFKFDKLSDDYSKSNCHIKFLNSIDIYNSFGVDMVSNIMDKNPSISLEAKAYTQHQLMSFGTMLKYLFNEIDIISLSEEFLHLIDDRDWILKKRLVTVKKIYASKKYVKTNHNVKHLSDISKHHCIINKYEDPTYWIVKDTNGTSHKVKINARISIDTFNLQQKLIERHLGIGLLPESIVKANPEMLEHIFTDFSGKVITSNILVNKYSLEKKPILNKVVKEIIEEAEALNYWD